MGESAKYSHLGLNLIFLSFNFTSKKTTPFPIIQVKRLCPLPSTLWVFFRPLILTKNIFQSGEGRNSGMGVLWHNYFPFQITIRVNKKYVVFLKTECWYYAIIITYDHYKQSAEYCPPCESLLHLKPRALFRPTASLSTKKKRQWINQKNWKYRQIQQQWINEKNK